MIFDYTSNYKMDCAAFKDKINLEGNINYCAVCTKKNEAAGSELKVVNYAVYYIYFNSNCSTLECIALGCELNLFEPLIVEAKNYLLGILHDSLNNIDKNLAAEVAKVRKGGQK